MISLYHIPKPNRIAACQDLVNVEGAETGYLMMKSKIHNLPIKVKIIQEIISKIKWDNKFVILYDGCIYVYNHNLDKKPERSFSLFGFTQITHIEDEQIYKMKWVFKIVCFVDERIKSYYFSAACEKDMNKWMIKIKKEMVKANNIQLNEIESQATDRISLQIPITNVDMLMDLKNNKEFRDNIADADSDVEYSYVPASSIVGPGEQKVREEQNRPPIPIQRNLLNKLKSNAPTKSVTTPPFSDSQNDHTNWEVSSIPEKGESLCAKFLKSADSSEPQTDFVKEKRKPPILPKFYPNPLENSSGDKLSSIFETNDNQEAIENSKLSNRPSLKVFPTLQKNLETEARWEGAAVEGQMLLVSNSCEGSYMIRRGTTEDNDVLLILNSSQLKKFKILLNNNLYYCLEPKGEAFETLHELLYYYRHNNLPNKNFKLIKPYSEL